MKVNKGSVLHLIVFISILIILIINKPLLISYLKADSGTNSKNHINTPIDTQKTDEVPQSIEKEDDEEIIHEEEQEEELEYTFYRLTSFFYGDGYGTGRCTGTGLCVKDFQVNELGWYVYKGKLVLAGATEELLRSGYSANGGNIRQDDKHYFKYYDEVTLEIDGVIYEGIILDSCGAASWWGETRIDLFVSAEQYKIDRGYKGKNMVPVLYQNK